MNFFNMPKPRRFNYRPVYSDERDERLRRLKERAGECDASAENKRTDGREMVNAGSQTDGYCISFARRKKKTSGSPLAMNTMQILVIIIVLVAVWRILLSL